MVPLSKSGVRKHRGFESRPLRHPRSHMDRPIRWPVRMCPGRGRLVDYGAALEMRFGATRREFESRPLRHTASVVDAPCVRCRLWCSLMHLRVHSLRSSAPPSPGRPLPPLTPISAGWDAPHQPSGGHRTPHRHPRYPSRAVLGGELAVPCSLQSAPAGLNPLSRSPFSVAARRCDVEDRVPRSGEPRTVSDPEGSSTKRSSSGAAERPGPSRSSWWARERVGRRRVHGTSHLPRAQDRSRS